MFIFPPRLEEWRAARTPHCPSLSKTEEWTECEREKEDLMEHEGDERQMRGGLNEADDKRDGGRERAEVV